MLEPTDHKTGIMQKAFELFMQYGMRSVSMDDIANASGMSKKTIYRYFTNKDDLVIEVVKIVLEKNAHNCERYNIAAENAIHESFLAIDQTTALFRKMNPLLIYDLKKYHPRAYKTYSEFKSELFYKVVKANLERGIREGLYREDLKVDVIARFRVESILIPFTPEYYNKVPIGLEEASKELFYLFLFGIASAKGSKLIEKYKKNKNVSYA